MAARVLALSLALAGAAPGAPGRAAEPLVTVYVGTYTDGSSRGIYRFSLDPASGEATQPLLAAEAKNPSFLALHPSGRFLFAVNETGEFAGRKTGAVSAFAVGPATGELTLLNQQPSEGTAPCHLAVDRSGKNLLVANYGSGTVALFRVGPDGRLAPASVVRTHTGRGGNPARQGEPHAHGVYFDPAERFVLAPDLGADRVFVYRFDAERGALEPHGAAALEPGSGPRHLAFHPSGRYVYVVNELSSTITVLSYDAAKGELAPIESVSALPAGFSGTSYPGEIEVSPDGRFVYASNRGHDSLAVFRVDPASGRLELAGHVPVGGSWPRHFTTLAAGRALAAAHQRGGTIALFRIDPKTGLPERLGASVAVDRPAQLLPVPGAR